MVSRPNIGHLMHYTNVDAPQGVTKRELQLRTRKNRRRLYVELAELQVVLKDVRYWRELAETLEQDSNGYKELIISFKKVFPTLKKNRSSSFVYGSAHYTKALKLALAGAWMGRSLSWSKNVTDEMDLAFQGFETFVELLDARAADRVRTKPRNHKRNSNMLTNAQRA
jgi:hypothetical protein